RVPAVSCRTGHPRWGSFPARGTRLTRLRPPPAPRHFDLPPCALTLLFGFPEIGFKLLDASDQPIQMIHIAVIVTRCLPTNLATDQPGFLERSYVNLNSFGGDIHAVGEFAFPRKRRPRR